MKNNVIPFSEYFQNQENTENCNQEDDFNQEYWQEQYERREASRLHITKEEIISESSNSAYISNRVGKLTKVIFENIEQVEQYEKQECENQSCANSWITCKEKFKVFPCKIICRYTKLGNKEGYVAKYMTIAEYKEDLEKQLEQAV